jgi:hypothetical protein
MTIGDEQHRTIYKLCKRISVEVSTSAQRMLRNCSSFGWTNVLEEMMVEEA